MPFALLRTGIFTLLARVLRSGGDAQLERALGAGLAQRLLLDAVTRRYDPSVRPGFAGSIALELTRPASGRGALLWRIDVRGHRAVASPARGPANGSALTVRIPVGDLVRVGRGQTDPAEPMLTGRATLSGDLALAAHLAEMFGAPTPA